MIVKVLLINCTVSIVCSIASYFLSLKILDICSEQFRFNYSFIYNLFTSLFFSILIVILKLNFPLVDEYFGILMISFFMCMVLAYLTIWYVYLYDFTSNDSNRRYAKVLAITQCSMVSAMPMLFFAI